MSGYRSSWNIHGSGDPVLRPRRRNIFFKGRRRSDRWMARLVVILALALVGVSLKLFWGAAPVQAEPVSRQAAVYIQGR